jgi:hypothetical protein
VSLRDGRDILVYEALAAYDSVMKLSVRVALAVVVLATGAMVALLLPARWTCPPMGYCPGFPRDLNAPFRAIGLLGGLVGAGIVFLVRRTSPR